MFVQFLVEDASGEVLIRAVMEKYKNENSNNIGYDIKSYKGIGNYKKSSDAKNVKSEYLLNDLQKRLKAFTVALKYIERASVFIVIDNDDRNTDEFRAELFELSQNNNISVDHVYCIAIEEIEAWLLGDINAMQSAYPEYKDRISSKHSNYMQDSICGTWEVLADILTKDGIGQFKKENPTFVEVGKRKSEWAERIGFYLNIKDNISPSFRYFIDELDIRNFI